MLNWKFKSGGASQDFLTFRGAKAPLTSGMAALLYTERWQLCFLFPWFKQNYSGINIPFKCMTIRKQNVLKCCQHPLPYVNRSLLRLRLLSISRMHFKIILISVTCVGWPNVIWTTCEKTKYRLRFQSGHSLTLPVQTFSSWSPQWIHMPL